MNKIFVSLLACIAVSSAWAATADGKGVVRRVNVDEGKILIKQEEITELNLPANTIAYRVKPSLITQIRAGDRVDFVVEVKDNQYYIIQITK